jgi:hypothetical protein
MRNTESEQYLEVLATNCKIRKDTQDTDKCIQPGRTIRRYVSNGTNWVTNFEAAPANTFVTLYIDETNGSETEYKTHYMALVGTHRMFSDFEQVHLFKEYRNISIVIVGTVTLKKSAYFRNVNLSISGVDTKTSILVIPSSYNITINNVNLKVCRMTIEAEGTIFNCAGIIHAIFGGYDHVYIRPHSTNGFNVFVYWNGEVPYKDSGMYHLTLALSRTHFHTDNIADYSDTCNIFWNRDGNTYTYGHLLLDLSGIVGWGDKHSTVFWKNGSDTISRVGTSGVHVIG